MMCNSLSGSSRHGWSWHDGEVHLSWPTHIHSCQSSLPVTDETDLLGSGCLFQSLDNLSPTVSLNYDCIVSLLDPPAEMIPFCALKCGIISFWEYWINGRYWVRRFVFTSSQPYFFLLFCWSDLSPWKKFLHSPLNWCNVYLLNLHWDHLCVYLVFVIFLEPVLVETSCQDQ